MNKHIKIYLTVFLVFASFSCNRYEVFEREQYKNLFALVSDDDNVSTWLHDLRLAESEGYVTASLGGTNPTGKDIRVTLVEDAGLIDDYNLVTYDVNRSRYIKALDRSKYTIPSYDLVIPAGEVRGVIPVKIRPEGLSPDSSYFIALRVDSYNAYEVNPDKDYLLYQVRIKNWWASYGGTRYDQRAKKAEVSSAISTDKFGNKLVFPLSENSFRIMTGDMLNDGFDPYVYKHRSMKVTILAGDKVKIEPYYDQEITQNDGDADYPNTAKVEDDGFKTYKTFLLAYTYKDADGVLYNFREELRIDFKEDVNDPRILTK
ncbi:MAG: DUF1735 domain-containing protein [Bacteroidales bacterium]|jgi:hypothetical protein|nr:DUF1735 domain-containing protein [Bacteroidales bacterium]